MKPKKIILIIIDTLRADHLGCYGYKRNTSPNIDDLANNGFLFKHAFSPSSLTIPSIGSILTSKYPGNHSIGFDPKRKLDPNIDFTLASILGKNNYKTAAFVSSDEIIKDTNLNTGFELYDDEIGLDQNGRRDCLTTNLQIIKWLEENYDQNFFLFVHYFDVHGPYVNQEPYKNEFVNDEFYGEPEYVQDTFDIDPAFDSIPSYQILNPVKNESANLLEHEKDVRYYKAQYDGCIKHLDNNLGEFIKKIKELGIYNDSLIIVTSDHGEAFGENNIFFYHGLTVTLDQTSVPLLLKPHVENEIKNRQINTPVSTIDIMPTVLSLCDHDYSSIRIEGHSLVKILEDEDDPLLKNRTLVSENEGQFALFHPSGLMELKKKDDPVSSFHPNMPALIDALNGKKFYWDSGNEYLLNIPFDQYQRYKIIADVINKFRINNEKFKILDIGASFEGNLKKFLPHDEIYFLDKEYPPEYEQKNNFITGDVTKIELNGTYDFVVSIDVYEHIHPVSREEFINRLLNLSTKATIIAAPFDTSGVREHEILANEVFKISHGIEHKWLHEHIQNGLPSLPFTLEMIKNSGFDPEVIPNGYLPRWHEMISIYLLTEGMQEFSKNMEELNDFYNKNFYCYDNRDPAYRHVIIINKTNQNIDFSDINALLPELDKDFSSKSEKLKSIIKEGKELCGNFRYKELLKKREQVAELTNTIAMLNNDLQSKDVRIRNLESQLQSIQQSMTWQMVLKYQRLIDRLLPQGTRRHHFYDTVMRGLRFIINRGFGSFLNEFKIKLMQIFSKKELTNSLRINHPQIVFKVKKETRILPSPLLSIVILEDVFNVNVLNSLYQSITRQTLNSMEIVNYSEKAKRITIWQQGKFDSKISRECGSMEEMNAELAGQYVYIPTDRFFLFPETFLESNLLALVSEDILFTINFFGIPNEISVQAIKDNVQDLLFIRKDLVTFEAMRFSTIKLRASIQNSIGKVVGRWVIQPQIENYSRTNSSLSATLGIEGFDLMNFNLYIIPKKSGSVLPSFIEHNISKVDEIFQEKAITYNKPVIMVFMPFLAVGGAEKLTLDILLRIKDRFEFVIVTVESPDPSIGEQTHIFKKVTSKIYHLAEFSSPQQFSSIFSYLIRKYNIKKLFAANGANWLYDEVSNIKNNFPDLKIVNQVFDHQYGWINRFTPKISKAIDVHIAVNRSIEHYYQDKYGIPSEKIRLIHHGIDILEFDPSKYDIDSINMLKRKLGLPEDRLIISFIARFHPQKRPMDFLKLAKNMESDEHFFFLIVGDGPLHDDVNGSIEHQKLSNLKRLPFYEPITDILSLTDILVITSEYEGLPLTLLNAQAMAVPVISTNVGCIAEVITTGENGILVEKIGDINTFKKGILTLAGINRREWGLRGRSRVVSEFNIEKVAKDYGKVLGE